MRQTRAGGFSRTRWGAAAQATNAQRFLLRAWTSTPFGWCRPNRSAALAATAPGPRRAVELTYGMLRGYGLAEPDLTDAVRLLRSTFHGFVALEAVGGFAHARSPQHSWVRTLDALHTLLEHWPPS